MIQDVIKVLGNDQKKNTITPELRLLNFGVEYFNPSAAKT